MKFGDKLIALRKKNGLSQEDLAEKLNVSRQSVSKWESNNTYPETDKIVHICNIFNCSMDDLINDNITDIEQVERKKKDSLNIKIDSLLDFITKTIDMFSSMTFTSGFKCIIELMIVAFGLGIVGMIIISILTGLLEGMISFVPNKYIINNFISSVLGIIWFVISLIGLVHIFKTRYLDYYEKVIEDKKVESKKETKNLDDDISTYSKNVKVRHREKVENVVIRDKNEEIPAFLSMLSKMVICFIKFFVGIASICCMGAVFGLIACFVVLIPFCLNSMLFLGIEIALLAGIIVSLLILVLLFCFILDKDVNIKLSIIIFIASILIGGIGSGVGILGLKDIEVKKAPAIDTPTKYEEKIHFSSDLYIEHIGYDVYYLADDTLIDDEIFVSANYDKNLFEVSSRYSDLDGMKGYALYNYSNMNFKKIYEVFIKNLKNNVLINYENYQFDSITVRANKKTLDKLMMNLSKMYLFEQHDTEKGILTSEYEYKVEIDDYDCSGSYDAVNDTMKINSRYCSCERKEIETYKGTKIEYRCGQLADEIDDED